MVATCCICKIERGQRDVSFHKIPKNEERRQQWLLAIGREVSKHSEVYSMHFAPNDFHNVYESSHRCLLPTAVPSVALPSVMQNIQNFESGSAVSKDITASDKSQENHGESQSQLIPTTSRLFDNTIMSLTEPANVPMSVQKISEPAVTPQQICKRKLKDMCTKTANCTAIPRFLDILDQMTSSQIEAG
ncbi:thap domain-containing protein 4 isoform x1 [Lasius niger]|uniref:Thap domain-containing protein 4 isoform x1 n=1 Tax=Lasius niger TaxID=67767 RepID=A0A0J7KB84_LASNI|nr:thap domain-containing protein 4 isoform x1 [Lasius niger]